MPTNDERRGAADALTDLLLGTITWPGMFKALGVRTRQDAVARLINLIEPEERTCHIEHIDEDSFHLSCGHEAAGHVSPSFCPYCGAEVVE